MFVKRSSPGVSFGHPPELRNRPRRQTGCASTPKRELWPEQQSDRCHSASSLISECWLSLSSLPERRRLQLGRLLCRQRAPVPPVFGHSAHLGEGLELESLLPGQESFLRCMLYRGSAELPPW